MEVNVWKLNLYKVKTFKRKVSHYSVAGTETNLVENLSRKETGNLVFKVLIDW